MILQTNPAFKAKKESTRAKYTSGAQFREILNAHSNNNTLQTFEPVVKINRSISCSRLNFKTQIMMGDWCVKVDGALSIWFGREYAVKKLFFCCPKWLWIFRPPVWSHIFITHPLTTIKGDNTPDEYHERLIEDMKKLSTNRFWLDFYLD